MHENVSWWMNDFDDAHCMPHNLLGDIRIRNASDMGLHRVTSQPEERDRADWKFDTSAFANPIY